MFAKRVWTFIVTGCLLTVTSGLALAQTPTTSCITGTVKDEKGAVIKGAEVTLTNEATANTDSEGV